MQRDKSIFLINYYKRLTLVKNITISEVLIIKILNN